MKRPEKITFGEMRQMGLHGVLIYCSDYKCSHSTAVGADRWPDQVRLSDIEQQFVCKACGARGADVRPDFADPEEEARLMSSWSTCFRPPIELPRWPDARDTRRRPRLYLRAFGVRAAID